MATASNAKSLVGTVLALAALLLIWFAYLFASWLGLGGVALFGLLGIVVLILGVRLLTPAE